MRLVGVARLDQRLRRERRRGLVGAVGARSRGSGRSGRPARRRRARARGCRPGRRRRGRPPTGGSRKATIASRVKVWMCSAGPSTGRPSGWSPNAARSIRCSATTDGWSLERAISWTTTPRSRSSSSASIFGRPTKSVSRSIASADDLGAAGEVEGDDVVRGVGVEHRAHLLGGLVDLAVVVVDLAALEHEVLEEVRHAVLLGALRAGAGLEGHEDGDGARALELDAVEGKAVGGGFRSRIEGMLLRLAGRLPVQGFLAGPSKDASVPSRTRWPPPTTAHAAAPRRPAAACSRRRSKGRSSTCAR